ncbi:MAG TPA: hypothetical protein VNJ02_01775 [Vicinamibacterales bacterium]|nr:hypothetical protein [Vicinamibacterales bacterium]
MRTQKFAAVIVFALLLGACASGRFGPKDSNKVPDGPRTLKELSVRERAALLSRASVWQAVDTASLDLKAGPPLPANMRIGDDVSCEFVFPKKALTGNTPKFNCEVRPDDVVKVKYGPKNGEVFAEVAASRLFWALGFRADRMYPAKVTCRDCPADPFAASKTDWKRGKPDNLGTHVFDPAAIERDLPGTAIEVKDFEGWAWPELDKIDTRGAGATRAQVDALKLLAVFIQHSDSKPEQQEIVCPPGSTKKDARGTESCGNPLLVVKDLGTTFGKATALNNSKMDLSDWDGSKVWKDADRCIGDLPRSFTGSLENPRISEAGRKFLSDRLAMLSDAQLRDLFTVAQVARRGDTVDEWVRVFKRKRAEIAQARCN